MTKLNVNGFASDDYNDAKIMYDHQVIVNATMSDRELLLTLDDGQSLRIMDRDPECNEDRYMTTDDDVASLVGHRLLYIWAKPGPNMPAIMTRNEGSNDDHETCFVEVATDDGFITLTNHNEHNGAYSGFALTVEWIWKS